MKFLLIAAAAVAALALYMLALASANTSRLSEHYNQLLILNGLVAGGLVGLVGYQLWQLKGKLRAGVFGSKLTLRLVLMFALVAVLPGALVYLVSFQFLNKSIETWFDVRVDSALDRGLNLGQVALDNVRVEQERIAGQIARQLSGKRSEELVVELGRLRDQHSVQQVAVYTPRGTLLAFAGSELPSAPTLVELGQVKSGPVSSIDSSTDHSLLVRVLTAFNSKAGGIGSDPRLLLLVQPVPRQLAEDADVLDSIRSEYKALSLSRGSLRLIYTVTLTLTLLLALLSVLSLAFFLSDRLSAPLSVLAAGTRAVAQGDFSQRQAVQSRDELGILTLQFNRMTRQLAEARDSVERQQHALAATNEYLESLLANLTAGVLAFDHGLQLRSANGSAERILGIDLSTLVGRRLSDWGEIQPALAAIARQVKQGFQHSDDPAWQAEIEYDGPSGRRMLLARGSLLPSSLHGFVMVFDDVTDLLQAQRQAAWGEVARRLAHEIKNPLTPIQLSAERLQLKLSDKLATPDADMLARSTQTIVNQVAALKNMVEDFKEYARAPKPMLSRLDLNGLVREVLTLYESSGWVDAKLADGPLWVEGDATRLRQVLHNLLQNAQDAVASHDRSDDASKPRIEVTTEANEKKINLTVQDNGSGFPADMLGRVFEPYVTTKAKGTGLGLAIVKKICEEHRGGVTVQNREPHGAMVSIELPRLQEGMGEKA